MKQIQKYIVTCCGILGTLVGGLPNADAHGGRRLDIQVLNNQLIAQGFNSGHDDGGGTIRPYHNAIHDHWRNSTTNPNLAFSSLPGFDIRTPSVLAGESLVLELMGAKKWVNTSPLETRSFLDLDSGENITIEFEIDPVTTYTFQTDSLLPQTFLFASNISSTGDYHFDLDFIINRQPTDTLYAIEWKLSALNSSILDSGSIFTILAPAGHSHHNHQSALALENFLGVTPIPEPAAASLLGLMTLVGLQRGRRVAKA